MLNPEDLKMHKAMMHILDNGSFSLKGREALAFAVVYQWFQRLAERSNASTPTEVKPSIKKRSKKK